MLRSDVSSCRLQRRRLFCNLELKESNPKEDVFAFAKKKIFILQYPNKPQKAGRSLHSKAILQTLTDIYSPN